VQHVLVHIDQGLGPIGAWSYKNGKLTHFYPESLDVSIPGRARLLMAQRDDDISVPEWMDFIADSTANLMDEYQAFEINETVPLSTILTEFRRTWSRQSD